MPRQDSDGGRRCHGSGAAHGAAHAPRHWSHLLTAARSVSALLLRKVLPQLSDLASMRGLTCAAEGGVGVLTC
jgi:hypothetical protein